jgi:hypothetical protein
VVNEGGGGISVVRAYVRFLPFLLHAIVSVAFSVQLSQNPEYLNASSAEVRAAIIRSYPMYIAGRVMAVAVLIDCLFVAFRRNRRALHDSLAGTFCVYKEKGAGQESSQNVADEETARKAVEEVSERMMEEM